MAVSPKAIDTIMKDSLRNQKKPYIMNQMSDLQSRMHNIHPVKPTFGSSSSIPVNSTACNQKSKPAVPTRTRIRRQDLNRKNRIPFRPPWVSSYGNTTTNSYPVNKHIKRTSISLRQQNDPCQVLEVYTRPNRIDCKPHECVCTPLPPSCNMSPCSFSYL